MTDAQTFTTSRTFDAPRGVMWKAWTEPKLFAQWFGPKGVTAQVHTMDVRVGGIVHSTLKMYNGYEMWAKFIYREVVKPSRLAWEHFFSDKEGGITRHPYQSEWPLKLLTTVVLEEEGSKTKLTLTWTPLEATEIERKAFADNMATMNQGWDGTFEQLETFLKSAQAA